MRIAIHQNPNIFNHYSSWSIPWIEYCKEHNLDYEVVDCYDYKIIEKLERFDILLWHFFGNVIQDMSFARSILYIAKKMGLKVFPDFNESWHFDDKIAETYLLQSVNAPMPKSWVFYTINDLNNWIETEGKFPIVAKLKSGSGSNNVKLIKDSKKLLKYSKRMFGRGYSPAPRVGFKAKSQLKSSKNIGEIKARFKKIPQFIETMRLGKQLPNEKGYVYFQEFTPNPGYDIKIAVVGNKLSFIGRNIRKDDFRASGGGDLFYDKNLVTKDIIESAFRIADELGFQCIGFDYLIDERISRGIIIEISYGFSHTALLNAGGYWDREGVWYDEPLNAPKNILKNIVAKM